VLHITGPAQKKTFAGGGGTSSPPPPGGGGGGGFPPPTPPPTPSPPQKKRGKEGKGGRGEGEREGKRGLTYLTKPRNSVCGRAPVVQVRSYVNMDTFCIGVKVVL